jgi:D-alanyl-D-alanine carboxypeptidase
VATAKRAETGESKPHRIFAVVLGAPTKHSRIEAAKQLVDFGFRVISAEHSPKS